MNKLLSYSETKSTIPIQEKIGQLFMPAAFINDSEKEILQIEKLITEQHIGGLCFFHSRASAATNFEGKKKVEYHKNSFKTLKKLINRYQQIAKYPLLVSIDAEWGLAMRVENTPQYPYAITLGAIQNNDELLFKVGKKIAKDCKLAGIHWNLAPVVDINNNPNNPVIGYRSFGEDKNNVISKALAFIKGTESEGILTCLKHFPGHGDTEIDSHLGLPLITKSKEELLANEIYPFQKLITDNVDSIMAGHLSVPSLADGDNIPSSLSKKMLKDLLRDELHFKGVVISDALNMHAVSKNYATKGELEWLAFDAGNDILCFAENITEGAKKILENASEAQIEKSFKRIWKLKEKAFKATNELTNFENSDTLNTKIAKESLTLYHGNLFDFKDNTFIGLEISQNQTSTFFNKIETAIPFDKFSTKSNSIDKLKSKFEDHENILIALFPPKTKPTNLFDISKEEINFINELILTKNVVLYLFGNPYVLNHIKADKTTATIIAYQNFKVFQENATNHFLEKCNAPGKIPVTIKAI
ncbi:glycoside hydrolase family 3 protein [Cellulophaga baltica]|uniref:glycoside hydrolase family 3 protein n=1 Tax=Cellulophaga TaxID=104264 RepID=UPI001C071C49|nr:MULTISPECIES: glycoside hydrolase family 3 N-terminal domain-containing protein [Cellulophaga]MBU2996483.1 glycoside hydrolase family 3 protein [Cellulophaga baltica]MDO6767877.1 glycoside hydrolase family 3 N-terminal domain-containing protein [Cellulophaga sp. 1_MG-2023]